MAEEPRPRDPLGMLTFAGRLLLLGTVVFVGIAFYFVVVFVNKKVQSGELPSGHYSVAFLLIPGVMTAAAFFVGGAFVLELLGVKIWTKSNNDGQAQ